MKEYGIRKFIPGQVINVMIDTEALDGSITKKRPYLIVASNNRRLVLLRMTHGGVYASNWLYSLEDKDGQTSNIICDCPITVNVANIVENYEHDTFFTPELFKEVFAKYMAAMIYQSVENFLNEDDAVNMVKDFIENHDERLLSYSRLSVTYSNGDDDEETDKEEEDIPATVVPVNSGSNRKENTEVTDIGSKIIAVTHKLGSVRPGEEASKLSKTSKSRRFGYNDSIGHRVLKPSRDYILATDCMIFNKGWTKSDAVSIGLAKLGLKNGRFIMDDLKNRNKVVYMNGSYNITLKSGLIFNTSKTRSNAHEYAREIIADCETVGFENAGLIWGRQTEFMRKNYWKFKEKLSNRSNNTEINVG